MADVKLKHRISRIDSTLFFYDGSKPVVGGVVTIPHGRAEWAGAAYLKGYVLDPDTGLELAPGEIKRRVMDKTGVPVESE